MDRIVNTVNARLDRSQQYEGRARRLTSDAGASNFHKLVTDPSPEPANQPAVSGWAGLVNFGNTGRDEAAPTPPANEPEAVPTVESVFGDNPWMTAPSGRGPLGVFYYNPIYFATAQTAEQVAQLIGGKVVQQNVFGGGMSPFQQLQANNMVELPDGHVINPGLVAAYYTHGYTQSHIDHLLAIEARGSGA